MRETISIRRYEEDLINTDKLAYGLAEAVSSAFVRNRKEFSKVIRNQVRTAQTIAKDYTEEQWLENTICNVGTSLMNKSQVEGMFNGMSFVSLQANDGEEEERITHNTFHFTTYASVRLNVGLYVCGSNDFLSVEFFDTIWAHGYDGRKHTLVLTGQTMDDIRDRATEYLKVLLVNKRFLNTEERMRESFKNLIVKQAV